MIWLDSLILVCQQVEQKENTKFKPLKHLVKNFSYRGVMSYNGRGISVYAFGFSLADNLSAQHMG